MKLRVEETNYAATIVKIHSLVELEGADKLNGFPIFGMQALVSKDHQVGEFGILFPTECQLSGEYVKVNNLYRDQNLNADPTQKGYFEDKRRVKAVKFLKGTHISNAFFMPLSSLDYLGIDTNELKEGDTFTHIDGVEICRKYVVKQTKKNEARNKTRGRTKKFLRIDNKLFPEHWDTMQYFRNVHQYADNDYVVATQKLHGTSARFTHQKVKKLSRIEKLVNKVDSYFYSRLAKNKRLANLYDKIFSWKIPFPVRYEFDRLAGSRQVIKDRKSSQEFNHYYENDLWNEWLEKIQHLIPKNWVLYGEIVGWVNDNKEIQTNYSYGIEPGKSELYIYRMTVVNEDGFVLDLSWDQIKGFCVTHGLKHVPVIWEGYHKDLKIDELMDTRYFPVYPQALPLGNNMKIVDEGVCIRKEGFVPYVTKAKSPIFIEHETKRLDKGEVDIETEESQGEE